MRIVSVLAIFSCILQIVGAKEYRLFEDGLCLETRNSYWTSTEQFVESEVLNLTEFKFRTFDDAPQNCAYPLQLAANENHDGTILSTEAPTAAPVAPRDPNAEQFVQVLFFKHGGATTELDMIGDRQNILCCSTDAARQGVCIESEIGNLVINRDLFQGEERLIKVPSSPDSTFFMDQEDDLSLIHVKEAGQYTLLMANCDYGGLNVELLPDSRAEDSERSHYIGFIVFYACLAVYTLGLTIAHGRSLARQRKSTRLPVQTYLSVTILIAFNDFAFKAFNFRGLSASENWAWSKIFIYAAIAIPILKRGMSMCLGVLVAKGFGIVEDSTGRLQAKIVNLGLIYTGLVAFRDYMSARWFDLMVPLDGDSDFSFISSLAVIVTLVVFVLDVLISIWVAFSFHSTIKTLRDDANQNLQDYLRLRQMTLGMMVLVSPWWIIRLLARVEGTYIISSEHQTFMLAAAIHFLYIVALTSVAILWRPRKKAQIGGKDDASQTETQAETHAETSTLLP